MSRHRMVRNMNYEEEYDGYYDVYGRSADDEYGVSPSTAAEFMYDRNKKSDMSAYFPTDEDIEEEDTDTGDAKPRERLDSVDFQYPKLSPVDSARLHSCLDEIRNVLGETMSEPTMIHAVLLSNFDFQKALDSLLNSGDNDPPRPQREKRETGRKPISADSISDVETYRPAGIVEGVMRLTFAPTVVINTQHTDAGSSKESTPLAGELSPSEQAEQKQDIEERTDQLLTAPDLVQATSRKSSAVGKGRASNAEVEAEYAKYKADTKPQLHLVVVGHVDAGKSTLMGHFLFKLGNVSSKTMHKHEQEAKKLGKQSFIYAWVLDETGEERSRGITMDIGQSQFETPNRSVRLLDAPGHRDFIPAMITGTAQADVALLVVDSTTGEFETGFEAGGQTREHALLVRSLGVSQLGVAVNKMDNVSWSHERFDEITAKLSQFLKQAGFRESDVTFVPCSGLTGQNLTAPPEKPLVEASWYTGPTLLQVIDAFKPPERSIQKPMRMPVNDVFKAASGGGFCAAGRVETGRIVPGDKVLVMPCTELAAVKTVTIDECTVSSAFAGDQVVLHLTGMDVVNVTVGSVVCDPSCPIPVVTRLQARIVVFNIQVPITKGFPVVFHCQSLTEPAVIKKLLSQIHKNTGEVVKKRPRCLMKNSQAEVEIEISRPICIDLYKNCKEVGRFMLRNGGSTIAAGMVTELLDV